jgi:hypothetical protein
MPPTILPNVAAPPLGVAVGYGALQQYMRDRQFALERQQVVGNQGLQAASLNQRAREAAQDAAQNQQRLQLAAMQASSDAQFRQQQALQQAYQFEAGRGDRAYEFDTQAQQRAYEFEQGLVPSERDQFLADQQQAAQQRSAELRVWADRQEIGQREEVQLKELKRKVGEIEAMPWSRQEKDEALSIVKTGIDPLERRAAQTQISRMEQQSKLVEEQAKKAAALENEVQAIRSQGVEQRIKQVTLPSGEKVNVMVQPDGKMDLIQGSRTQQQKPIDEAALWGEAQKMVLDQYKARGVEGDRLNDQQLLKDVRGQFELLRLLKGAQGGQPQPGPAPGAGGGVPGPGAPPPLPGVPGAEPPPFVPEPQGRAIDPYDAGTQTPEQGEITKSLIQAGNRIAEADLPPERRDQLIQLQQAALELYARFGSLDAMPPDAREAFDGIKDQLKSVQAPSAQERASKAAEAERKRLEPYERVRKSYGVLLDARRKAADAERRADTRPDDNAAWEAWSKAQDDLRRAELEYEEARAGGQ